MLVANVWMASYNLDISLCCITTEIASEGLKGRVFEVALADLQNDEIAFRKFKLMSEEVQGRNVLTNFHGMDMTTDKLKSMVKKFQVSCPNNNNNNHFMLCG